MLKKLLFSTTSLALALTLAACQDQSETDTTATDTATEETTETETAETETAETEEAETSEESSEEESSEASNTDSEELSADNNMIVDEENKSIQLYAEVNGDALETPTQHGVVTKDGSNADVAIFHSLTDTADFHDALSQIGAEPGDNVAMEDLELPEGEGVTVEGSALDITVSWEGQDPIPFQDVLESENPGIAQADFRFGGNLEANTEMGTGCTICLASCPIGIVSNAGVPTDEYMALEAFANTDVLPEAGTPVTIEISLAE